LEGQSFAQLIEQGSRVVGVRTECGDEHRSDFILIAAGAWTPTLLPHLSDVMWATGQPVVHFQVPNVAEWQAPRFPVWAADIARTGWYGFPALDDGTFKIGNHGPGRRVHPDEPRTMLPEEEAKFRAFVRETFPALADAPVIGSRLCLYCDTFDGNFWIDHDPHWPGLVVAAGDSGHGFKFAPVLGGLIADVVEEKPNPFAARFRWRERRAGVKEESRAK
ncbi:MAG: FAD-dependent oxidoreductase, partial [Verrucomicrobia bacterium]|nr:FAD-dependent oxidoreductase [Verrucomicrobiota bacterium]